MEELDKNLVKIINKAFSKKFDIDHNRIDRLGPEHIKAIVDELGAEYNPPENLREESGLISYGKYMSHLRTKKLLGKK